jgi:hypothetical protein
MPAALKRVCFCVVVERLNQKRIIRVAEDRAADRRRRVRPEHAEMFEFSDRTKLRRRFDALVTCVSSPKAALGIPFASIAKSTTRSSRVKKNPPRCVTIAGPRLTTKRSIFGEAIS